MLKLCENGSNIDYLYETSSVLRKATETEISGLNFGFGSVRVFKNRNEIQFPHIPNLLNVACLCVCLGLNSAEMYDPRLNEWRYVTCMSTRRSSVGVGVVAGPSVRPSIRLSVCLSVWKHAWLSILIVWSLSQLNVSIWYHTTVQRATKNRVLQLISCKSTLGFPQHKNSNSSLHSVGPYYHHYYYYYCCCYSVIF